MKRLLTAGLLAALLLAGSVQKSHAWSKFNFGAGVNWSWQGGGNSVLWGLAKGENTADGMMRGGFGGPMDGGGEPVMPPAMAPAAPPAPEKVAPPTPLRPASYQYQQQPAAAAQKAAQQAPVYAPPSYWYGR